MVRPYMVLHPHKNTVPFLRYLDRKANRSLRIFEEGNNVYIHEPLLVTTKQVQPMAKARAKSRMGQDSTPGAGCLRAQLVAASPDPKGYVLERRRGHVGAPGPLPSEDSAPPAASTSPAFQVHEAAAKAPVEASASVRRVFEVDRSGLRRDLSERHKPGGRAALERGPRDRARAACLPHARADRQSHHFEDGCELGQAPPAQRCRSPTSPSDLKVGPWRLQLAEIAKSQCFDLLMHLSHISACIERRAPTR